MSFWERVKAVFAPQVVYKIVEVRVPRNKVRAWDDNTREAVASLSHHPGFLALVERLELTKSQITSSLNFTQHKELRHVDFLQAGIFWSGWLQDFVNKATQRGSQKQYVDPEQEELEAFKVLDAKIERLGSPDDKPIGV